MSKKRTERDPADWQEAHDPTEAVTVRITGTRRKEQARQRKSAIRLFDGLLEDEQDAMIEINDAFNSITGAVNGSIMLYEADYVPGTGDRGHRIETLRRTYIEWAEIGVRGKFNHAATLDVICFGKTLETVDRERRRRHGFAKENMKDAIKEWLDLRGRR